MLGGGVSMFKSDSCSTTGVGGLFRNSIVHEEENLHAGGWGCWGVVSYQR